MHIASCLAFLTLITVPAPAADLGPHAKVGAHVGVQCDNTTEAFAAGFASHIALDYLVYGTTLYSDGETYNSDYVIPTVGLSLLQMGQVYKQYKRTKDKRLLYGAIGGMFPDLVDMVYHGALDNDGYVFGWHARRSTLLVHDPPSVAASRKSAQYNLLLGATLWSIKF